MEGKALAIIGLIRHGVTDWNQQKRAQGQHDVPLNEEGIRQARQLAKRLSEEKWDYIYSSDLARARQTAEIIAEAMGKPLVIDTRLREKSHGRLDGTTVAERVVKWGENWKVLDHGEEKDQTIADRSRQFLEEVTARHPGSRVLIVSHGAWIRITLTMLLGHAEFDFIENTSVCVLHKQETDWSCLLMNCTKHLHKV
jgi:probable phosphoglycerate mutase